MPSTSKSQQRAAGMALAAKRGEMKASELQGAAKEMYDSMSEKQLEDFAKTKHDDLPEKVEESIVVEGYEKDVLNILDSAGIEYAYFFNGKLYMKKESIRTAKEALKRAIDNREIFKTPSIIGERDGGSIEVKDGMKPWKKKKKSRLASELEENYSFPDKYDWIDSSFGRMTRLNKVLNEAKYDEKKFIDLLYKNVDLNEPDDFAIEMIIISADEFMGKKMDKKEAKEILKKFDKKYTRVKN